MTKQIPLSQGKFALVDDWNYEEVNKYKWCAQKNAGSGYFYAMRTCLIDGKRKSIYMHRVIAKTPKGLMVDHKNHNTLDNRECNIRNVTNAQNQLNRPALSINKLGIKCIGLEDGLYRVSIYATGGKPFRKSFKTLDEAIAVRDEMLKKFHGEFAYKGGVR